MVRTDAIDLGVWKHVSPARLVVPLDTHVIRLGRCLRLTRYASPGWKMAADITATLRGIDPADPVRYDFSLCHVGMMNACGYGRRQGDAQCPLEGRCAGLVRFVSRRRFLHHPLDGEEPPRPREAAAAHTTPQRLILQQLDDARGQRRRIARRHQEARFRRPPRLPGRRRRRSPRQAFRRPSRRRATCTCPRASS